MDRDYIGKWLIEEHGEDKFKGKVLLSDGETGIEKHPLFKGMEHQRCVACGEGFRVYALAGWAYQGSEGCFGEAI